jgi:hypothetical protein
MHNPSRSDHGLPPATPCRFIPHITLIEILTQHIDNFEILLLVYDDATLVRGTTAEGGGVPMADDGPWLTVPQAVVLEATRDIELTLKLTDNNPDFLVAKANNLIALRTEIPLQEHADKEQRDDAFRKLREARIAMQDNSHYLDAQQRVHWRLVAGVRTKARRTPAGPYESVDQVEYTGAELREVDAIDKRTRTVMLFDLRINAYDLIESLTGKPVRPAGANSSRALALGQMQEHSSQQVVDKWECAGDPVPKLIDWARSRWGDDLQKLPNRRELLDTFRGQFGRVLGVNEKTMREVRRQLASREARRGGAPLHRR